MFLKNDKKDVIKPQKTSPPSIISSDLKIKGNLVSKGEIQIDGHVKGDIQCNLLLVGKDAQINGSVIVERLEIHGKVLGEIKARVIKLAKSAHVIGDILHEELAIETGAFLEGHCKHSTFEKVIDTGGSNTLEKRALETSSTKDESLKIITKDPKTSILDKPAEKILEKPTAKV